MCLVEIYFYWQVRCIGCMWTILTSFIASLFLHLLQITWPGGNWNRFREWARLIADIECTLVCLVHYQIFNQEQLSEDGFQILLHNNWSWSFHGMSQMKTIIITTCISLLCIILLFTCCWSCSLATLLWLLLLHSCLTLTILYCIA